jgi:hypothetical protein
MDIRVRTKVCLHKGILGTLGYKYETNEGNNTNIRDTFSGLTLSAMAAFLVPSLLSLSLRTGMT